MLQIDLEDDGDWEHTYVVDHVDGTYGSRTVYDIEICAHTTDRKCEYLDEIGFTTDEHFRTLHVSGTGEN